jgi:hypothetical protein
MMKQLQNEQRRMKKQLEELTAFVIPATEALTEFMAWYFTHVAYIQNGLPNDSLTDLYAVVDKVRLALERLVPNAQN